MTRLLKRLAWIVAVAALAVAATLALVFVLLPRDALKSRIGEQIAAWTGRDVSLRGEPVIGLFPTLTVSLDDVEIGGPQDMQDSEILSMDRLKGRISLLPLIIGRVEVDSFTMVRPRLRLVRDAEGRRNWRFNSGAAALQLAFSGDVPLGEFRLEDATIIYENRERSETERLDSVNLAIDWESVRKPIAIEGSAIWRGEQVAISGSAQRPFAYLTGSTTPVEARIEAPPVNIVLSGEASDYPRMQLSGGLKLSSPSLRRLASWLGSSIGPGATLGATSLFGTATLSDNVLSVADAQFTLDGNAASGALKIALRPKPDITGTLAFGALDLTPYFSGLSSAFSLGREWRSASLSTGWFANADADIRLSADTVKFGTLSAGRSAASVSLRDERLEIGLAQATFDAGRLAGDLTITDPPGTPAPLIAAQLRATDIALAEAARFVPLPRAISGTASAMVDLTAEGGDLGSIVASLGGAADIKVVDGRIPLFGLPEIAAGGDMPAQPDAGDLTLIDVQSANARLSFAGGVGTVERASVVTDAYSAEATGSVRLLDGRVALSGILQPGPPGAAAAALPPQPFTIEGTLARPVAQRQALAN